MDLAPVTRGQPEVLVRTYRFVVQDHGPAPQAADISAGSSVDSAIENQVENVVFNRVNHTQMFELHLKNCVRLGEHPPGSGIPTQGAKIRSNGNWLSEWCRSVTELTP